MGTVQKWRWIARYVLQQGADNYKSIVPAACIGR
jgi:hypothetical protein